MKRRIMLLFILSALGLLLGCQKTAAPAATLSPIELPAPKVNLSVSNDDAAVAVQTPPPESEDSFLSEPEEMPGETYIVITKSKLTLELYGDDELIGRFPIRIGSVEGHKEKEGDKRTPEGEYYICSRKDNTENTLFLGISYPNGEDAKAAYSEKLIDKKTRDAIIKAIGSQKRPPWNTALGGSIGIHGKYDDKDATQGCIAVSDENVEIIWKYAQLGTPVEILP